MRMWKSYDVDQKQINRKRILETLSIAFVVLKSVNKAVHGGSTGVCFTHKTTQLIESANEPLRNLHE